MKTDYDNDYVSVTQVLDCLRKKGLEEYFKNNTPEFLATESVKNLTIGSLGHEIIQNYIEKEKFEFETEYPVEIKNLTASLFLFKKDYPQVRLKKAEIPVTSKKYKYNGKIDSLGTEKGKLILIDWKTGKCNVGTKKETEKPIIYPEHCYQAAAYVKAYNEQMKANIEKAIIVSIAKDKIAYNTMILLKNAMEKMFNGLFLPLLKVCYYQIRTEGGKENGTGQRNCSNSERSGGHSQPSRELPSSF